MYPFDLFGLIIKLFYQNGRKYVSLHTLKYILFVKIKLRRSYLSHVYDWLISSDHAFEINEQYHTKRQNAPHSVIFDCCEFH